MTVNTFDRNTRSHTGSTTAPTAVILAAGRGSRLGHHTKDKPKCLAEVGGVSLIEHQLAALESAAIEDVVVVTGYCADEIHAAVGDRVRYVHNAFWRGTNSLFSLWLAREYIGDDVIVLNCDVLFHEAAILRLVDAGANRFAIDSRGGLGDEEMHVTLQGSRLVAMSKQVPLEEVHGENVGIVRMTGATLNAVLAAADGLIGRRQFDAWMASAIQLVAPSHALYAIDISDLPWIEIDFPQDLALAERAVWPAINLLTSPTEIVFHRTTVRVAA